MVDVLKKTNKSLKYEQKDDEMPNKHVDGRKKSYKQWLKKLKSTILCEEGNSYLVKQWAAV